MSDAASPTTNTPGAFTTFRKGSTSARPARSVVVPSIFGIGDAATPAVHSTVALGIRLPPATTPSASTVSTFAPVKTFTPSFVSRRVTLRDSDSAKVGSTRLPASSRMILACAGSMWRKLPRSVTFTICARDAASSTPVGPAPTSTNVIGRCGQFERAQDFGPDRLGVAEVLESRRMLRELVVPEVARAHAGRDQQIVVGDLADAHARGRCLDGAGNNIDAGDLRQEHAEVSLLDLELSDRRRDIGGREHCRRHLIEQWLEYVVVAAIDQDDIDISVPQRTCRGDSGKASADDDDALSLPVGSLDAAGRLVRPSLGQHRTHRFTSLVLIVIDGFSELLSGTMLSGARPRRTL